jgi:hypothetical protein
MQNDFYHAHILSNSQPGSKTGETNWTELGTAVPQLVCTCVKQLFVLLEHLFPFDISSDHILLNILAKYFLLLFSVQRISFLSISVKQSYIRFACSWSYYIFVSQKKSNIQLKLKIAKLIG